MSKVMVAGAALGAALLAGGPAGAHAIYSNIGAATNGADPISSLLEPAGFGPLADSFSTGAGGFNLADVKVLFRGNSSGGSIVVSLLADNATSPGAVLASTGPVSDSFLTGSPTVQDFSLSAALAPNTRYWIQLSSPDNSRALWAWSLDQARTGVPGQFFDNQRGVFPNSDGPYQMRLTDGAVPEPSTWAMMIVGLAGAGALARSRRKALAAA
jgi:hypothetical protein